MKRHSVCMCLCMIFVRDKECVWKRVNVVQNWLNKKVVGICDRYWENTLTVGESKFRCGKSKSRICTKPIESWLDRLRTMSGVSALSNETVCESDISKPRRHRVSASITSSVARSDIEMARLCSTSLLWTKQNKRKTYCKSNILCIQQVQKSKKKLI